MGNPLTFDVNATVKGEDGKPILDDNGDKQTVGGDITYDFGDTLAEAVEKFGEAPVFSNFVAQAKVRVQSIGRSALGSGKSLEEAQAAVDAYVVGSAPVRTKKDNFDAYKKQFLTADPAKQKEMLKELAESAKK